MTRFEGLILFSSTVISDSLESTEVVDSQHDLVHAHEPLPVLSVCHLTDTRIFVYFMGKIYTNTVYRICVQTRSQLIVPFVLEYPMGCSLLNVTT